MTSFQSIDGQTRDFSAGRSEPNAPGLDVRSALTESRELSLIERFGFLLATVDGQGVVLPIGWMILSVEHGLLSPDTGEELDLECAVSETIRAMRFVVLPADDVPGPLSASPPGAEQHRTAEQLGSECPRSAVS